MDPEDIAYEDSVSSDTAGWPGDGSGEDDFQDYNQNESGDYYNE